MGFIDTILGFFGGVAGEIESILAYLFDLFITALQFIFSILAAFGDFILNVFKSVGTFFLHLWDNFFKGIFLRVFHAIGTLTTWLESHLRPIIEWLQRAQRYILHLYTVYVRPILVMIQRIRQVLAILRALHVQWAQDLDNILAHIQSDINAVFLKINGALNAVIDVLNIVTDPARFLRHPVLILSIRRSFSALIRQLTGLPPGFWFPSPKHSAPAGTGKLPLTFLPSDDAANPPPSYYMGVDTPVPSLGGWASGTEVPDNYGDDVPVLDFFTNSAWPSSSCPDGVVCFLLAVGASRARVSNG
jgi:hypothetical protein